MRHLFLLLCFLLASPAISASTVTNAQALMLSGRYRQALELWRSESKGAKTDDRYSSRDTDSEEWRLVAGRAALTLGEYEEAEKIVAPILQRYYTTVRGRLLAREICFYRNQPARARELLDEINQLGGTRMWAYRDALSLVALGQAALLLKAEPKLVLQSFYDRARQVDPNCREAYLASGDLALEKNDYELAGRLFQDGLRKFAKDAEFHFGLARAFFPSDRRRAISQLQSALTQNSNHVPSLLLMAEHLIDSENYEDAEGLLVKALKVNPSQPEAWAFRAVIAHLQNLAKVEETSRERALQHYRTNPRVDYLIGLKLSQKYRFAEGAAHQRRALKLEEDFLPSQIQLAQDLLRLGDEDDGWKRAEEVHKADAYDVVAYNLVTLQDTLSKFKTLTNQHFILRMSPSEADLYGERALKLLEAAHTNLCAKYEIVLPQRTIVEVFPNQKDFAVRTFGMPGNPGYLGVCFGSVVTANSPAANPGHPSNWEAVLWHEFCHVVTLQMTRNRMPRWLSEGISVYEERQANKSWGEKMTPAYREMILKGELTPIGELSGAFLSPKSDRHLQFAYFESSLVVEFLLQEYGLPSLKKILKDLAAGEEINKTIEAQSAPLEQLEEKFAAFAKKKAEAFGSGLDWEKPPANLNPVDQAWKFSNNYWVLQQNARKAMADKNWEKAEESLKIILQHYPENVEADSPYRLLAKIQQTKGNAEEEERLLEKLALQSSDDPDAYQRLMELGAARKDWKSVEKNAERFLAVNPLSPEPYRFLAQSADAAGNADQAIGAYRQVLQLDPADPAQIHFRLAVLLEPKVKAEARRHLLQALEEAPRFQEAHQLLLKVSGDSKVE